MLLSALDPSELPFSLKLLPFHPDLSLRSIWKPPSLLDNKMLPSLPDLSPRLTWERPSPPKLLLFPRRIPRFIAELVDNLLAGCLRRRHCRVEAQVKVPPMIQEAVRITMRGQSFSKKELNPDYRPEIILSAQLYQYTNVFVVRRVHVIVQINPKLLKVPYRVYRTFHLLKELHDTITGSKTRQLS